MFLSTCGYLSPERLDRKLPEWQTFSPEMVGGIASKSFEELSKAVEGMQYPPSDNPGMQLVYYACLKEGHAFSEIELSDIHASLYANVMTKRWLNLSLVCSFVSPPLVWLLSSNNLWLTAGAWRVGAASNFIAWNATGKLPDGKSDWADLRRDAWKALSDRIQLVAEALLSLNQENPSLAKEIATAVNITHIFRLIMSEDPKAAIHASLRYLSHARKEVLKLQPQLLDKLLREEV